MININFFPQKNNNIDHPLSINGIEVPYFYKLEADNITVRLKGEKRAYSHGFTPTGDGYIDGKTIKLTLFVDGKNKADFTNRVNELCRMLYQTDYELSNGDGYWIAKGLTKISTKYVKGFQFVRGEITASILLSDPFRYGMLRNTRVMTKEGKSTSIKITNFGSVETPMLIVITPVATANDITFTLGNKSMHLQDALLTNPAKLIVDTAKGTVRRDKFNAINTFSGQFLTAAVGENILTYTGNSADVFVQIRDRWLV